MPYPLDTAARGARQAERWPAGREGTGAAQEEMMTLWMVQKPGSSRLLRMPAPTMPMPCISHVASGLCDETVAARPKETTTTGMAEEPKKLSMSEGIRNSEEIMSPGGNPYTTYPCLALSAL